MENPNVSELLLLLEVTKLEDLARYSKQNNQRDARERLGRVEEVAKGFRNLVTDPELYDVQDEDLQHWATILKTELDRVEKSSSSRDLEVEQLSTDLLNDTPFSNALGNALRGTQSRAFPNASV